jgi:glucose-6-phosphate isomerase
MSHWNRFQQFLVRESDLGVSLDISRMDFDADFFTRMEGLCAQAFSEMKDLEAGKIVNADEGRMVGHYWLRKPELAPTPALAQAIKDDVDEAIDFAKKVHAGEIKPTSGGKFTRMLVIGIGGSALGPQLVAEALVDSWKAPMKTHFFDNTDPDGLSRVIDEIGSELKQTLTVVISKSGGTPETRNGMLTAEAAYTAAGLDFSRHAVAVTGTEANGIKSKLEAYATEKKWLKIVPMTDWVGGRTSVLSTVGLVPMTLQGIDVRSMLSGAAAMDEKTRTQPTKKNMAMLLALMWHWAGQGRGAKDMVVLPYKDRLGLFSKYLQQLVMESLGKELDRDGKKVNQGIAVYGNKGSTDQHAYVQQLRDGVNNFFATLIEVRQASAQPMIEVEPGITSGDYLQGFLRGTRSALHDNGRESITISIEKLNAHSLGMLIALFERAVSFYATLVNINAYHQPGVEAGKKAAGAFLSLFTAARAALTTTPQTADQIAATTKLDAETVFHALTHLATNDPRVTSVLGETAAEDKFGLKS